MWNYVNSSDPTLGNSLFGAVKLIKNADIDKYNCSGYGIGFDMEGTFSFPTSGFGSSLQVGNKKKYILILREGPTQGLDDTRLTAEKKYSINLLSISISV